jgi:hypothetical protein
MNLFNIVSDVINPITGLIDKVHTSDEEKLELQKDIKKIEAELSFKLLDYQKELIQAQSKIITAEAQGESWLQRNWRPLVMLTLVGLVVSYFFGLAPEYLINNPDIVEELFSIVKIGLGGYVIGRSAEKGIREWKKIKE